MKKIIGITVLFLGFVFQSCDPWEDENYQEDDIPVGEVSVVGTWRLTSFLIEGGIDLNNDGVANTDLIIETNCYLNEVLIFENDSNGTIKSNTYLDISLENEEYEMECVEEESEEAFLWVQNGEDVTLTLEDLIVSATLEGNNLTFVLPDAFVFPTPEGVVSEDVTMKYQKVL